MNFMAKGSSQGFYGEDQNQNQIMISNSTRGNLPFYSSSSTSSSSSSSSQPHKNLVPLTFHQQQNQHHQHQHQHQPQRGSWLEPQQPSAEDMTSMRCYTGGAGMGMEHMDASPAATGNNGDHNHHRDNDVNGLLGLGGGGGGGGGGGTSTCVGVVMEKEHMFDKVVTPSDVGKLNRLVIPKQHAEKYFPLDSSTNEKGLLLNFEDRNGKPWRFRYSYWNSSQSYVMTKGWSRFVKEKKLDAGDIVSFQRGVGELGKDRLFIDWRRRPDVSVLPPSLPSLPLSQQYFSFHRSTAAANHPWSPLLLQQTQAAPNSRRDHSLFQHINATNYQQPHSTNYGYSYSGSGGGGGPYSYNYNSVVNPCSSSVIYLRSAAGAASSPQQAGMVQLQSGFGGGGGGGGVNSESEVEPMVFESVPVVHGKAAAKRLRLFGVNMDCPMSESDQECDILSSTTVPHPHATMASHLSSSPIHHPLQLRLYSGSPLPPLHTTDSDSSDLLDKGKSSDMSFDFDF
ncbi:hypothetical protein ACSBR2_023180 [Camellia fascicularis]